ncbi:MAG: GNAT family N-acetyltransferase [Candidatus Hydrogenedentes bacterium]|nr:GNAT family N-acetyltransferase [Candidatus Hydrogenedentota bacterium]
MEWRYFDPGQDLDAAIRLWHDIGWMNREAAGARPGMEAYTAACTGYVALVHGLPECFVFQTPGNLRHGHAELPLCAVAGVATSRNARKQGLALRLTARAIAEAAVQGAAIAGLSTFEQGFYNRIGFGSAAYEHTWSLDPARLTVTGAVRPPHRLENLPAEALHEARRNRHRAHGSVTLDSPLMTRATMLRTPNGFGLGYSDDPKETPSHGLWCGTANPGHGPYTIEFLAWKTPAQFRELLGLIRQWGDQVRLVVLPEPAGIQLQDLIDRPTQHYWSTEGGNFASGNRAHAYYQYRILDLGACVRATRLATPPLDFNLQLHDPMQAHPVPGVDWNGIAGGYTVRLGPESDLRDGHDPALPVLTASAGAFTRLWLGVRPATGLAVTDELAGPPELLAALDETLRLPAPVTDWRF